MDTLFFTFFTFFKLRTLHLRSEVMEHIRVCKIDRRSNKYFIGIETKKQEDVPDGEVYVS